MNERQQQMLDAFADYEPRHALNLMDRIIGMPPGTRLYRLVRMHDSWKIWLATRDYIFGSCLILLNDGTVIRHDISPDQEDEYTIRPSDDEIRRNMR